MIKGTQSYLSDLALRNLCAEHGEGLSVAWNAEAASHVLRCAHGEFPDALRHYMEPALEAKTQGEPAGLLPATKRRQLRDSNRPGPEPATPESFAGAPTTDLATGEVISLGMLQALCLYARKYDLDPYRGHVCIMHGRPYISIDGYLYHANKSRIPYSLISCPLDDEQRKTYQVPDGAHAWLSRVIYRETGQAFSGLGIVTQAEMTEMSVKHPDKLRSPVVAAHPWQLAQKRAEWQALRRAFPIGESEPGEEK